MSGPIRDDTDSSLAIERFTKRMVERLAACDGSTDGPQLRWPRARLGTRMSWESAPPRIGDDFSCLRTPISNRYPGLRIAVFRYSGIRIPS